MSIELMQVSADDVRLDRLLQLYMHEWSARIPVPFGEDARFVYDDLPAYRDASTHQAWLALDGRMPVGFALAMRDDRGTWHVEEMFVIAAARRRGVGAEVARGLFAARPGPWTLTVRPENPDALRFWRRVMPGAVEAEEPGDDHVVRTRLTVSLHRNAAPPPGVTHT